MRLHHEKVFFLFQNSQDFAEAIDIAGQEYSLPPGTSDLKGIRVTDVV
jgi:hypothetical protein